MKKRTSLFVLFSLSVMVLTAQPRFSITTDLSVLHNFKKGQQYTSIGQTVQANFHLTPKDGIYTWFAYYSNGWIKDNLVATARSTSTTPQSIPYLNRGRMRLKQVSIGWKKYLLGNSETDNRINVYAYAGFGLVLGRIINTHSVDIDTSLYNLPVLKGQANFKRLTIDPGIGMERYLGADIYCYGELRAWIPTTDYPSRYIFVNENAPWTGMACIGLRILF